MIKRLKYLRRCMKLGQMYLLDKTHVGGAALSEREKAKRPLRSDVINYLLRQLPGKDLRYLEIGVRNPASNFDLIEAARKYSVDPGLEFKDNPVQFAMTSDDFFDGIRNGQVLDPGVRFDVVFIDGLHVATQVVKDIRNALSFLADPGYLVLHDCNPPTEYHAREDYGYLLGPAEGSWNGTTWKAFYRSRLDPNLTCFCVDTDWGVGVIMNRPSSNHLPGDINPFLEFETFSKNRRESMNLVSFDEFKHQLGQLSR